VVPTVQTFPRNVFLTERCWVGLLVFSVGLSILGDSGCWILPVVALALLQGLYVYRFVRCPECSQRMEPFQEEISGSTRYRFQFLCKPCDVAWDTGKICDDETT